MTFMLPEYLDRLAQIQSGILTANQALRAGMSWTGIRSRLRSGRWQTMHHGVYATFTGQPCREAILWAAVLRAGRGALLSHYTAAELHGLVKVPSTPVHITIPPTRRIMPIRGAVIHIVVRAELRAHPTQLPPRTRLEETVLDLTQLASNPEEACGWITRCLGGRLTTQEELRDAASIRPRMRFRSQIAELLTEDFAGVHSALEYRYVKWVEVPHGLPAGKRQVRVRRGGRSEYRDVLYEEHGLVVELDGRAAHPGEARWDDVRRDNAAAADGLTTLRYGWDDLSVRACLVAAQVHRALSRSGRPVPGRSCSPTCPVGRNS